MNKYIKVDNTFYNLGDKNIGFSYCVSNTNEEDMLFHCDIQESSILLGVSETTEKESEDTVQGLVSNFEVFLNDDKGEKVFDAVLNFEELVKEAENKKVQ